jgi:hypothetical protein
MVNDKKAAKVSEEWHRRQPKSQIIELPSRRWQFTNCFGLIGNAGSQDDRK